jgi:hypothetical protein
MKKNDNEIYLQDEDWIKRGKWDLNVNKLEQFFTVIGAGIAGNPKTVAEFIQSPVALNMPDWLLVDVVNHLDENKKGNAVPDEIRTKFKKLTNVPESKKPQKRRVVLKNER